MSILTFDAWRVCRIISTIRPYSDERAIFLELGEKLPSADSGIYLFGTRRMPSLSIPVVFPARGCAELNLERENGFEFFWDSPDTKLICLAFLFFGTKI
jgi:hypothetical protein